MRTTDPHPYGRQRSPHPQPPSPAAFWLVFAALLATAALLAFVGAPRAWAQDASGADQEGGQRDRSGETGRSGGGSSGGSSGGSGNALGVIVDIPDGWPLGDGGGDHDIVRFEKCFPFCHVERPSGDSSGSDNGSDEQTSIIEQTQIQEETQTDEGTTEDPGTDQYETDDGTTGSGGDDNGGGGGNGGGGEDEPQEPTISEETTVLEETTAPPGEAKCPTGPSGPISEVTLTQVLDADTLQVEGSDGNAYTIRLIGAEAPDLVGGGAEGGESEPGAEEAAAFARETLGGRGQTLELEYDARKTDENGQTFAYVWRQGGPGGSEPGGATQELLDRDETAEPVLFNRELVESGYARAATAEPNTDYAECLKQAEQTARDDGAGLWFEQTSYPGQGDSAPRAGETAAARAAAEAISIALVSSKNPRSKPGADAPARDAAVPPITRHAEAPASVTPRAAHPGLAIGVAAAILVASLLVSVTLRRGGGVGTAEGSAN